jgi:hypothetical protein
LLVVVVAMRMEYHVVVVAAVAVVPIWLRKSADCKEHKQHKY